MNAASFKEPTRVEAAVRHHLRNKKNKSIKNNGSSFSFFIFQMHQSQVPETHATCLTAERVRSLVADKAVVNTPPDPL